MGQIGSKPDMSENKMIRITILFSLFKIVYPATSLDPSTGCEYYGGYLKQKDQNGVGAGELGLAVDYLPYLCDDCDGGEAFEYDVEVHAVNKSSYSGQIGFSINTAKIVCKKNGRCRIDSHSQVCPQADYLDKPFNFNEFVRSVDRR